MRPPPMVQRAASALLVIDFQEKLAALIAERHRIEANLGRLVCAARLLSVPVLATEQYPQGLGPTTAGLRRWLEEPLQKLAFSCCGEPVVRERIASVRRRQWVLVGIETHICVAQTALELTALPEVEEVYVVADACGARRELDHTTALARLRHAGVHVTTAEAVLFEWLRRAGTDEFRAVSRLVRMSDEAVLTATEDLIAGRSKDHDQGQCG